jgi:hypothetical protein
MWGIIPFLIFSGILKEFSAEVVRMFGVILFPASVVFLLILGLLIRTKRIAQIPGI